MKGKLSFMWRATLALVLVLSLGVVMATPVVADVSEPAVTVDPVLELVAAEYTIVFTNTNTIPGGNTITVTFPTSAGTDTVVPATGTYSDGDITVQGASIAGADVTVTGQVVVIALPTSIAAGTEITVVFTLAAGIINPSAEADVTLLVKTQVETTDVTSATYDILALPSVTTVQPDKGNAGETMWVEVTGTAFTGTATACTTSFTFGTGVSVVADSYHWISTISVDCQITIASDATAGARVVTVTSAAGVDASPPSAFTVGAAGTDQVDVWDKYTPVTDLANDDWDSETLVMTVVVQTTIEAAVDAASSSDVVRVHAATYNPVASGPSAINIDEASVNLVAFGTVIIVPVRDGGNAFGSGVISISAANVIVDGFTLQNVATSVAGDCGIKAIAGGTTFIIQNNTVSGFGNAVTNLPANTRAIEAYAVAGTILDNTVEDNRLGIQTTGTGSTLMTIQGNLVQNNYWGIALFGTSSNNLVIKNRILANYGGLDVNASVTAVEFYTNDIVGNTKGFNNCSAANQDARYNWWGDISGPSAYDHISAALGSGDTVNDIPGGYLVSYEPWLTETQSVTVTDGIAYFGSTMVLQPGWNTLSVPLKLKDSANTIAEIAALGDFLTDTNWEIAYQYNPATPGWENIGTSAIELVPGRGYYIKILGTVAVNLPVLYSGTLGLPTYDLTTAGWNLIGSMFGIDDTATTDYGIAATGGTDGQMTVLLALDSITANTSVVVSPYLPGQVLAFGTNSSGSANMQVGEAYWVFMEATDTLAGFEVTPIYKVFLQ